MGQLHDRSISMIQSRTMRAATAKVTDALVEKLTAAGFRPTPSQRSRIRKQVASGDFSSFTFRTLPGQTRVTHLQFTDAESKELEAYLARLTAAASRVFADAPAKEARRHVARLHKRWPARRKADGRARAAFERRLEVRWGAALSSLEMLILIAREAGELILREASGAPDFASPSMLDVIARLHARACQVASEVSALLAKGFADGAMARWRTLHEISVVAAFITDHGEPLAIRYLDHLAVEARKGMLRYIEFQSRANLRPISKRDRDATEKRYQAVLAKYGNDFREDYGWAAGYVRLSPNQRKPDFSTIEKEIGRDHLRPYVRLASQNVHAGATGAFYKLGLPPGFDVLAADASFFGLDSPGQNAAMSLALTTITLVRLHTSFDVLLYVHAVERVMDEACRAFARIHRKTIKDFRSERKQR